MDDIVKRLQGLNRSPDHDHAFIISAGDVADAIGEIDNLRAFIASLGPTVEGLEGKMANLVARNREVAAILNVEQDNG